MRRSEDETLPRSQFGHTEMSGDGLVERPSVVAIHSCIPLVDCIRGGVEVTPCPQRILVLRREQGDSAGFLPKIPLCYRKGKQWGNRRQRIGVPDQFGLTAAPGIIADGQCQKRGRCHFVCQRQLTSARAQSIRKVG